MFVSRVLFMWFTKTYGSRSKQFDENSLTFLIRVLRQTKTIRSIKRLIWRTNTKLVFSPCHATELPYFTIGRFASCDVTMTTNTSGVWAPTFRRSAGFFGGEIKHGGQSGWARRIVMDFLLLAALYTFVFAVASFVLLCGANQYFRNGLIGWVRFNLIGVGKFGPPAVFCYFSWQLTPGSPFRN